MSEKTIGTLAKFTGVSVHTIKYYEKIGLLPSPRDEKSNYRSYDVRSCTAIYECMKYRNLGFSLKEIKELVSEADDERLKELLASRSTELDHEINNLIRMKSLVDHYRFELDRLDHCLGKWYIEECPDFYFRPQTDALNYKDQAWLSSDGINLTDYAPESSSSLQISPEYFAGNIQAFSWGHGIFTEPGTDTFKDKKGFLFVPAGRAFVLYLRLTGNYASQGFLAQEFLKLYREYSTKLPTGTAYGLRLKITHDEDGNEQDYFKIFLPL